MQPLQVDRMGALFVLVWASGYIGGSIAAETIAPLTANLWRFVLGGAVLAWRTVLYILILSDFRKAFWKTAKHALRRGQIGKIQRESEALARVAAQRHEHKGSPGVQLHAGLEAGFEPPPVLGPVPA